MNKTIGIVLLNYKNYKDTIECIKTILVQSYENYKIIVVDNCSKNDSLEYIEKNFKEYNNIYYIQNDKNLGFAKGNNIGINYARQKLLCDFVFVLNSDTLLKDKETLKKLLNCYKDNIGVINPMCCDVNNRLQRPYLVCKSSLKRYIRNMGIYILGKYIKIMFEIKKSFNSESINIIEEINDSKYVIQGCAYVLTPAYFKYYNQIFSETFLYCEELALCVYIDKANLKTHTNCDVEIIHKEGGSTVKIIKDMEIKKIKYQINSFFKILKLYLFYDYEKIKKIYDR